MSEYEWHERWNSQKYKRKNEIYKNIVDIINVLKPDCTAQDEKNKWT